MDLDKKVYLYYDFIGGGKMTPAIRDHFETDKYDEMAELGQVRYFIESAMSAREVYAMFAGCDSVSGNDAILDGLHEIMSGCRVRYAADEGNYFMTMSDSGPSVDLSIEDERSTAHDLTGFDSSRDSLRKEIGSSRLAILRVRTSEGAKYVAIAEDGRSHSWEGDLAVGDDTVEIIRALEEAGTMPEEVRVLMNAAAREILESERDQSPVPGL